MTNDKSSKCPFCGGRITTGYELFNKVHEDSVSDYYPEFDELKGGQIFVNLNSISEEERLEISKRLGPKHDVLMMDDEI